MGRLLCAPSSSSDSMCHSVSPCVPCSAALSCCCCVPRSESVVLAGMPVAAQRRAADWLQQHGVRIEYNSKTSVADISQT